MLHYNKHSKYDLNPLLILFVLCIFVFVDIVVHTVSSVLTKHKNNVLFFTEKPHMPDLSWRCWAAFANLGRHHKLKKYYY